MDCTGRYLQEVPDNAAAPGSAQRPGAWLVFQSAEKVPGPLLRRATKDLCFQNSAEERRIIIGSGEDYVGYPESLRCPLPPEDHTCQA